MSSAKKPIWRVLDDCIYGSGCAYLQMGSYNEPEYLSALSRQILGAMLQKDPRYRPTTVDLLNHKWVTMECFDPVTYASIYKVKIFFQI